MLYASQVAPKKKRLSMALSVDRESNGGCESCDALHLVASLAQVRLRTRLEKRSCLLKQLLNFTDAFVHAETLRMQIQSCGVGRYLRRADHNSHDVQHPCTDIS